MLIAACGVAVVASPSSRISVKSGGAGCSGPPDGSHRDLLPGESRTSG